MTDTDLTSTTTTTAADGTKTTTGKDGKKISTGPKGGYTTFPQPDGTILIHWNLPVPCGRCMLPPVPSGRFQ